MYQGLPTDRGLGDRGVVTFVDPRYCVSGGPEGVPTFLEPTSRVLPLTPVLPVAGLDSRDL